MSVEELLKLVTDCGQELGVFFSDYGVHTLVQFTVLISITYLEFYRFWTLKLKAQGFLSSLLSCS